MRLLCIDDEGCTQIKSGVEYNGTNDTPQIFCLPVYFIYEVGEPYDKNRFIPLDDNTTEASLVNDKQEEYA